MYYYIHKYIFKMCILTYTQKHIIFILLAAVIYTYCTPYRMHFLFFFLFILCTPIYPFFISFFIHTLPYLFLLAAFAGITTLSADGYIFFAFLFVCTFHISFLVFDIYFKFVFCILVLFIFFTSFLFFFCFSFIFLLFFFCFFIFFCFYGTFEFITTL